MIAHGPQALTDIAPDPRVDHRHAPVIALVAKQLDLRSKARHYAVGVDLRAIGEEELFDSVSLVTQAEYEIRVPILAVVVHHMPEDWLVANRNHRLGKAL